MRRLLVLMLLFTAVAAADPFQDGLEGYQASAYARAADSFRVAVAENPRDPSAHFNLGLCYFELEDWGRARASWETAWTLAPQWSAPGKALQRMQERIRDGQRELPGNRPTSHWLSLGQWVGLAALGWWMLVAGAILGHLKPSNGAQLLFSFGLLLLGLGVFGTAARYLESPRAVVVASKVYLKNGPGSEFTDGLSLYSGHLVEVEAREGSWVEVSVRGRVHGWLRSGQLQEIPSY